MEYKVSQIESQNNPKFASNKVKTTKYSFIDFIPKCTFYQFKRLANVYFLITAILMCFPILTPIHPLTAIGPLTFVIALAMVKEAIEDLKRRKYDKEANNSQALKLIDEEWTEVRWKDIRTGDLIKVQDGENIPCDLLVLYTSSPLKDCKIQTSNLDGERTLKTKWAIEPASKIFEEGNYPQDLAVNVNPPDHRLEHFSGKLLLNGTEHWVESKNLLWRGSNIKHTDSVIGMAVYTGKHTKLMMCRRTAPFKQSKYEHLLNKIVVLELLLQIVMCGFSGVSAGLYMSDREDYYMYEGQDISPLLAGGIALVTFFLLYNTLIPISLIISLEIVKFIQALFMEVDVRMYDEVQDLPAKVQTFNIIEELGHVDYIFSDKTGTLTSNNMEFKGCVIGTETYENSRMIYEENDSRVSIDYSIGGSLKQAAYSLTQRGEFSMAAATPKAKSFVFWNFNQSQIQADLRQKNAWLIKEFMTCILVCNNIVSEIHEDELSYIGASPDEVTLVDAAKQMGFVFLERKGDVLVTSINQKVIEFTILAINEFTSERKRMSVVVRMPNGEVRLFIKGADVIIESLLDYSVPQPFLESCKTGVTLFAEKGLRTLCFGVKSISTEIIEDWFERYKLEKCTPGESQKERLEKLAEEIETDIIMIGVSALEDKLQEGVPKAIQSFTEAGIKTWMITGDKLETAENVALTCNLLQNDWTVLKSIDGIPVGTTALIIESDELTRGLEDPEALFGLVENCASVVIARANPKIKASVVSFVHSMDKKAVTLAIGDGGNDVPMLQTAHIGVGIYGSEGHQAANSADFSIGQFVFLKELLFVHGRWNIKRIGFFILYFFYKNIFVTLPQFFFSFYSAFSGQTVWDDWYLLNYNSNLTAFGVILYGILEQDINPRTEPFYKKFMPALYKETKETEPLTLKKYFIWMGYALYSSIVVFGIGWLCYYRAIVNGEGKVEGLWATSVCMYTSIIICVNSILVVLIRTWTWVHFFVITVLGYLLYFPTFVFIYDVVPYQYVSFYLKEFLSTAIFWFTSLLTSVLVILPFYLILVDRFLFNSQLCEKLIGTKFNDERETTQNHTAKNDHITHKET